MGECSFKMDLKSKLTIYDEEMHRLTYPLNSANDDDKSPKFKTFISNDRKLAISLSRTISSDTVAMPSYFDSFRTFAIFSCTGGYFAGILQSKGIIQLHKAFHRVVSAKTGTFPLLLMLGKYDENKHKKEILELLQKWKEEIAKCDCIFLHAPGKNKSFFFNKGGLEKVQTLYY